MTKLSVALKNKQLATSLVASIFFFALALQCSATENYSGCLTHLIRQQTTNSNASEAEILTKFNPRSPRVKMEKKLSSSSVFRVSDASGIKFVVRFPSSFDNPQRELFVSKILRNISEFETPEIRLFSEDDTAALLDKIKYYDRFDYDKASRDLANLDSSIPKQASLAIYYPLESGGSILTAVNGKELTKEVKSQLAEYWSAYTVVGIPDFHPGNWLLHEEKVIGIDLAIPRENAPKNTTAFELPFHQHPFVIQPIPLTPEQRNELLGLVRKEFKEKLNAITKEKILKAAQESHYPATNEEVQEILDRLQFAKTH